MRGVVGVVAGLDFPSMTRGDFRGAFTHGNLVAKQIPSVQILDFTDQRA